MAMCIYFSKNDEEMKHTYDINLDIKFDHLQVIDIPTLVSDTNSKWYNQSLTTVNNSVIRLGVIEGEYHWHKHDRDDEFFLVLDGELLIDLERGTVVLKKFQGITIPRGVIHRTRALQKTTIVMVETKAIRPTGD